MGDDGGAPAPIAPDAGAPAPVADPAPAPAPADPTPAPAPAPAPAPTPGNPTIQPGQSPTDLDLETLLNDAEAEANGAQPPADPNQPDPNAPPQPPADPNAPPVDPNAPPAADPNAPDPNAPPATPPPANEPIDYSVVDNHFNVEADEEFGIAPIGDLRNPEAGETAQDYFKAVTLPAVMQVVKNMGGMAQRNLAIEQRGIEDQSNQRQQAWKGEIDALIGSKAIPAYTLDAQGSVDPNSEGGKIIAQTFQLMNEHNAKPENANRKITSFDHGYRALTQPAIAQAEKDAANAAANDKRRGANGVLNSKPGTAPGRQPGTPQHIRKGQSPTDLDMEQLLG